MTNPGNVAGGHKAALKNPNVSEEAKEHSQQVLDQLQESGEYTDPQDNKNKGNVIGGYKATLSNPNTSEDAKEHAREVLEEEGVEYKK
ncbi:hypothetical protein FRC02_001669 [Tulasnella sp. 418]|nr:hypothetical protein FRC02_001669 [Tulasnella sp. 418]